MGRRGHRGKGAIGLVLEERRASVERQRGDAVLERAKGGAERIANRVEKGRQHRVDIIETNSQ
jgi:hypothetical protein